MKKINITGVTFHVPPENQGQMVEVSYGMDDDQLVIERTVDRSDGLTNYRYVEVDYDRCDYQPWCEAPLLVDRRNKTGLLVAGMIQRAGHEDPLSYAVWCEDWADGIRQIEESCDQQVDGDNTTFYSRDDPNLEVRARMHGLSL